MSRVTLFAVTLALIAGFFGAFGYDQLTDSASAAPPGRPTVPVEEQNLDENGYIRVHEQGTSDVNVTNASLPVNGSVSVSNLPLDANGDVRVTSEAAQPSQPVAMFRVGDPASEGVAEGSYFSLDVVLLARPVSGTDGDVVQVDIVTEIDGTLDEVFLRGTDAQRFYNLLQQYDAGVAAP